MEPAVVAQEKASVSTTNQVDPWMAWVSKSTERRKILEADTTPLQVPSPKPTRSWRNSSLVRRSWHSSWVLLVVSASSALAALDSSIGASKNAVITRLKALALKK